MCNLVLLKETEKFIVLIFLMANYAILYPSVIGCPYLYILTVYLFLCIQPH